jgi:hypothetical protein
MGKTKEIYCCVPGCLSKGIKGFYHLPSNGYFRSQWLKRSKTMHIQTVKELKNSRICYKHFEKKDFEASFDQSNDTRTRLRKTAVPSQCLPGPLTLKFEHNYASVCKLFENNYL